MRQFPRVPLRTRNFLIILLAFAATACTRPAQPDLPQSVTLAADKTIGQTFVAEFDGLMGMEVYQTNGEVPPEGVSLTLRDAEAVFAGGRVPVTGGATPGWVRYPFEPRKDSASHYYSASFEADGPGSLQLAAAPLDSYPDGALHRNGEPQDKQLAFRLVYHPGWAALGLLREAGAALLLVAAFAGLFVLPGWAIVSALWRGWAERDGLEKLALASATGLALYPILFLWTHLFGWNWGAWYAWLPPVLSLAWLLWRRRGSPKFTKLSRSLIPNPQFLIFFALLLSRLWPLRTLAAPMFGDGYQHALITQLLLDNGGLFSSWQPYAPLTTFTYHFGFHASSAVFAWATGLSAMKSVLWMGQLLNVLAVLVLYPLANRLSGGRKWAGLAALALAGLAAPMPAFYTNWGRYTQLAGQAILMAWVFFALEMFAAPKREGRLDVLGALLLGGLALSHYRVLIFAIVFVAAYWLVHVWEAGLKQAAARTFWAGIGGAVLFLPRFWQVFGGGILVIVGAQLATAPAAVDAATEAYNQFGELSAYLPGWVWALSGIALVYAAWKRERKMLVVGGWAGLLLLVANPGWLGLPGTGAVNNFTILIAAYIPAGLLVGWGVSRFEDKIRTLRIATPARWAAFAGLGAVTLWGMVSQTGYVTPAGYALVTRPDERAAHWIQENLPEDAFILVNAFPAGGGQTAAGSDAGWYLPLLAHRRVTLPPFIYISEQAETPAYRGQVVALTNALVTEGAAHPDTLAMLRALGVTHVYIGQLHGRVNYSGPSLDADVLLASPAFGLVYHADGVWVFEVR